MTASNDRDVFTYMNAYQLLDVPDAADSSQVRRAYLGLVRQHHPDRQAAGSIEQQHATEQLTKINEAYALIREAPLRFHRVSRASDPDMPWNDAELNDAIDRARMNRKVDVAINLGLVVVMIVLLPMMARGFASVSPQSPLRASVLMLVGLASSVALWSMLGSRSWQSLLKIQVVLLILRLLTSRLF